MVVGGILFFLVIILGILYYHCSMSEYETNSKKGIDSNLLSDIHKIYKMFLQELKKKRINREDRFLLLLPIIILFAYNRMNTIIEPTPFDTYCERTCKATVEGKIVQITENERSISYYLDHVTLYPNLDISIPIKQKLLAYASLDSNFKVGNTVQFTGTVSQLSKATNEGQFDSYRYYLSQNIRYQMYVETTKCIDNSSSWYASALTSLRSKLAEVYQGILPAKETGIIQAMLLGEKQVIDGEVKNLYQKNGIAHILAISGLHVSFLGLLLYKFCKKIGCSIILNTSIVTIVIISYGIMTGFSVSTNRAVVMLLVSLFAIVIGRTYDMLSAISLSALMILIQNPMQLYNTGFQLSFLAVCTLAVFGEVYEKLKEENKGKNDGENKVENSNRKCRHGDSYKGKQKRNEEQQKKFNIEKLCIEKLLNLIKMLRKACINQKLDNVLLAIDESLYRRFKLKESNRGKALQASMFITAITAPILATNYCEIPSYSILLNLFVLPLMSILMTLGVVAGLMGLWWIDLAKILGYGITCILNIYEILCKAFAKLPFHLVLTGKPSLAQIVFYYGMLIGIIVIVVITRRRKLIYLVAFLWIVLLRLPTSDLTMTMLDISQGDSIYINTPNGVSILVDGGSSDVKEIGKYRIEPFLKANRIRNIDYAILTHMDTDHINGIMEIMERMPDVKQVSVMNNGQQYILKSLVFYDGQVGIQNLILPKTSLVDETYTKIEELAVRKGIVLHYFGKGDVIAEGELTITCLHPYLDYNTDSKNDTSVVLELSYGKFNALLLGDLESGGEKELIKLLKGDSALSTNQPTLKKKQYDIIKIAHHGSKYSTTEEFLTYYDAKFAWISSGYNNRYGHPHRELLERLEKNQILYKWTVKEGAITIRTDGERMWEE